MVLAAPVPPKNGPCAIITQPKNRTATTGANYSSTTKKRTLCNYYSTKEPNSNHWSQLLRYHQKTDLVQLLLNQRTEQQPLEPITPVPPKNGPCAIITQSEDRTAIDGTATPTKNYF